jgi:hypothetical protein
VIRGQEWGLIGIGELQHSCNRGAVEQNRREKRISIAKQSAPMLIDTNPLRATPHRPTRGRSDNRTRKQINVRPHANLLADDRLIPTRTIRVLYTRIHSQFTMKALPRMKDDKLAQERIAYRVPTLASVLDLSPHYIRKEIRLGKLRAYKVGSIWIISADDARSWLAGFPTNQAQGAGSTRRTVAPSPATLN